MNIKKKIKGIEFKTLMFILIFNIGIILLLWFSENIIFSLLYRNYQINKMNNIIEEFNFSNKDTYVLAEQLAYENEVCIKVIDNNYVAFNFNTLQKGCVLNNNDKIINNKIKKFILSDKASDYFNITNYKTDTKGILYAFKTNSKNVFIYSNLENVSSFIKLFQGQKIYFILLIILCSVLISFFLANKITKPIREITKKAKSLGEGKYDTKFPKNGVLEIEELSKTLEEVQKELSKSDELKRDLMANVSHDLKTPLTMIKAYAEMIKDISHKEPKKMNEHLDIIMEETDRLTILVNDILELSKVQNDSYMYNYEEYDLIKEIKGIIKRYSVMKELEEYKFILDLPKKVIVKADKNKINQVMYNLLNNAINYTGKDKIVKIKVTKENKDYLVEIIDTGKGIKKDELSYIWDKYYKNEKNHRRNVVSTGLGLSIVKEILNKHNFEYGVTSEINKGSVFYFKINML
ncbi:MAG: HAMP domain-containing histidine kinase [Firmicutes bacterium]|nr:HAMP domain-containing histidine kinase [Bacillota bacterium]